MRGDRDDLEERIAEVEAIKRFGEELGLDFGDAFEKVELEKPLLFYWLYASYKDRIECPPLRGRGGWDKGRPYNLYKSSNSARKRAKNWKSKDLTLLSTAQRCTVVQIAQSPWPC